MGDESYLEPPSIGLKCIKKNESCVVLFVEENGPAMRAGIIPGDRIEIRLNLLDLFRISANNIQHFSLSLGGNTFSITNHGLALTPTVITEGNLNLKWSNGGVRGKALSGILGGFWINLIFEKPYNLDDEITSLVLSFEIPMTFSGGQLINNDLQRK